MDKYPSLLIFQQTGQTHNGSSLRYKSPAARIYRERESQITDDLSEGPGVGGGFGASQEDIDIDAWAERIKEEDSIKMSTSETSRG